MNQFKSIFLGTVNPNSDFAQLKSAVNSQKVFAAYTRQLETLADLYAVYPCRW
ncbi:hypothetical protein BDW69DRAFT_166162 [Aspergillus filifer]